jgi:hypothetical protein
MAIAAAAWSCSSTSSSTQESMEAGAGGGTQCGALTQCEDTDVQSGCISCAELGPCVDELNQCHMSEDCLQYGQCIKACGEGDDECTIACDNQFPEGSSAYASLLHCVICEQCPVSCDGPGSGC